MTLSIRISEPGGRSWLLRSLGLHADEAWSWGWPYGCLEASWSMALPVTSQHPAFTYGNHVQILDGTGPVFGGILSEVRHGEPWTLNARGFYSLAKDYQARDATGAPTSIPSVAVEQAIARGLPWTMPATGISTQPFTSNEETRKVNTVADLLNAWTTSIGQRWGVDALGQLFVAPDPVTPTLHLRTGTAFMGSADDEFITDIWAEYVTAVDIDGKPTATARVLVTDEEAVAAYRTRREYELDLTGLGIMEALDATAHAKGRLDLGRARMGYVDAVEVGRGELRTVGDVPQRLTLLRTPVMMRAFTVADSQGNVRPGLTVDEVVGEIRCNPDGTAVLAPVGMVPRTLSDVLAAPQAEKPADEQFTEA